MSDKNKEEREMGDLNRFGEIDKTLGNLDRFVVNDQDSGSSHSNGDGSQNGGNPSNGNGEE